MGRGPGVALMGLALACSGLAACAAEEAEGTVVTIGVASAPSLSDAFTEIIEIFERENPGVRVHLELGRSVELSEGLANRTDINVFASASEEAMAYVVEQGVATETQVFARNHVVMAVPSGNPRQVRGLEDLERPGVRVGICDESLPCGKAAKTLLTAAGVTPPAVTLEVGSRALSSRLADNELDVGIVYRTDVAGSHGWVTQTDVDPREQEMMREAGTTRYILSRVPRGEDGPEAEDERVASAEFRALVTSDRGRRVLENAGLEALPS